MAVDAWFTASKKGLGKLVASRDKVFVIYELLQNAWDENPTRVDVHVGEWKDGYVRVIVEDDDPDGILNLSDMWTLHAESKKKGDPTKRGLFDIGEKYVLSICSEAKITSTKGTVIFHRDGTRTTTSTKRERGTKFDGRVKMTKTEREQMLRDARRAIPPDDMPTYINGELLQARTPLVKFRERLETRVADKSGEMQRSYRTTDVLAYEVPEGETAMIYEKGIPIVETGDKYHLNVMQRVPQPTDRDNVPPAYLRTLRTAVLNHTHHLLTQDDAASTWALDALSDKRVKPEAVRDTIVARFGEKAVIRDASDKEANSKADSLGYELVGGGTFNKQQWANIKSSDALLPAGQVFPTPRPFSGVDTTGENMVPESEWTAQMRETVEFTRWLGNELLGHPVGIIIARRMDDGRSAAYGDRTIYFCFNRLGRKWFDLQSNLTAIVSLTAHELAHAFERDHYQPKFREALERFCGKIAECVLHHPERFRSALAEV